ncbi:MAG: hypothetical protein QGF59_04395 [Pirellulaceae bacterium]|jgi:hypothetical protein|nr:hypothetical protein [Pirellulaceae bacterium]
MSVVAKKFGAICVVLAGTALFPFRGLAIELDLTPAQVFAVWTGINESLLVIARVVSNDTAWHREISEIRSKDVKDKRPADVLGQLRKYRAKLDGLRRTAGLKPIRRFVVDGKPVTPVVVYVNSGLVLNGQVEWLIHNTGSIQLVSQFYPTYDQVGSSERTPSHVYALVNLANRRLAKILAKAGVSERVMPSGSAAP